MDRGFAFRLRFLFPRGDHDCQDDPQRSSIIPARENSGYISRTANWTEEEDSRRQEINILGGGVVGLMFGIAKTAKTAKTAPGKQYSATFYGRKFAMGRRQVFTSRSDSSRMWWLWFVDLFLTPGRRGTASRFQSHRSLEIAAHLNRPAPCKLK